MNPATPELAREAYDALERERFSTLKHFAKSPAHYLEAKAAKFDSAAMLRGRCVHLAVLEPAKLRTEVVLFGGSSRRGKEWERFEADNKGKEILLGSELYAVERAARAVRESKQAAPYLEAGRAEVTVLWESMGVKLKSRLDWVADCGVILDLKSTKDASPSGFPKEVANYQTLAQAAFYVDAWKHATGESLPYVLLAVEASAPFAVQTYRVPEHLLEVGRIQYRSWLATLSRCLKTGVWEAYAPGELELVMPLWFQPQGEAQ